MATKAFELPDDGGVVVVVEGQKDEAGEVAEREAERPRRVLTEPMQKPPVRLGNDREGRVPSARRVREEASRAGMLPVGAVQEGDEDTAVQEDGAGLHGRGRP
jgi:hypothetical protein